MLLVDADIVAYRAASSTEREIEFEPDMWALYSDHNLALEAFTDALTGICSRAPQANYRLCFSHHENFRKQLNPLYKANRRDMRKPMGFGALLRKIKEKFAPVVVQWPRLEADDVIGILATDPDAAHVIWSPDKDLKQIPGLHLTDDGITAITEEEGERSFLTQVLVGDTTDNYKGCPGIGPVKAEKILNADATTPAWNRIVIQYLNAGLDENEALLNARMARILRHGDYIPSTGKVRLWKPTA
jgi:DNA polymerase I